MIITSFVMCWLLCLRLHLLSYGDYFSLCSSTIVFWDCIVFNLLRIIHILYSLCSQLSVTLGKCTCIDYKNIKSQCVIFQNYPLFQLIDNTIIDIYEGNFRNLPILGFWLFKRDQQLGTEGVLLSGQWEIEVSVRSWVVIQRLWRGEYWIDTELPRLDLREEDGG